jgi:hypothetical protein
VDIDVKLGVFTLEKAERECHILKMVESTLNNNRKNIENLNTRA